MNYKMKLYYFWAGTYGSEYFVMAETKDEAIACVWAAARKDFKSMKPVWSESTFEGSVYESSVTEILAKPDEHIREYNRGEVIMSEIC